MKVALIGNGLTNLVLAKVLANKNIFVSMHYEDNKKKILNSRTLAVSNENLKFLNSESINIKKYIHPIKKILIFHEKNNNQEIIKFDNKKNLFCIIKYFDFLSFLTKKNLNNRYITKKKIKNKSFYKKIIKKNNFDLVINSESNNLISKFFSKKIIKNYNSFAYTTLARHSKIKFNSTAIQIFTKWGPLAYLPLSENTTSIVFSVYDNKQFSEEELKKIIIKYNKFYKFNSFDKFEKSNLHFSLLKNYYFKNILCFGDVLHKIHPLAGQGFNMTLRDIKIFNKIIKKNLNLGLPIGENVLDDFQDQTKHLNFTFATFVDYLNSFFKMDVKNDYNIFQNVFRKLNKSKLTKKYINFFADNGFI